MQRRLPKHKTNKQTKLNKTFPNKQKVYTLINKNQSSPKERNQKIIHCRPKET
jgi:hypothetical protein